MSAAIAPVPPELLCQILRGVGYTVVGEDDFNWALTRDKGEAPIIVPKKGDVVAIDVLMGALHHAKMDNRTYFTLRDNFLNNRGTVTTPDQPSITQESA